MQLLHTTAGWYPFLLLYPLNTNCVIKSSILSVTLLTFLVFLQHAAHTVCRESRCVRAIFFLATGGILSLIESEIIIPLTESNSPCLVWLFVCKHNCVSVQFCLCVGLASHCSFLASQKVYKYFAFKLFN